MTYSQVSPSLFEIPESQFGSVGFRYPSAAGREAPGASCSNRNTEYTNSGSSLPATSASYYSHSQSSQMPAAQSPECEPGLAAQGTLANYLLMSPLVNSAAQPPNEHELKASHQRQRKVDEFIAAKNVEFRDRAVVLELSKVVQQQSEKVTASLHSVLQQHMEAVVADSSLTAVNSKMDRLIEMTREQRNTSIKSATLANDVAAKDMRAVATELQARVHRLENELRDCRGQNSKLIDLLQTTAMFRPATPHAFVDHKCGAVENPCALPDSTGITVPPQTELAPSPEISALRIRQIPASQTTAEQRAAEWAEEHAKITGRQSCVTAKDALSNHDKPEFFLPARKHRREKDKVSPAMQDVERLSFELEDDIFGPPAHRPSRLAQREKRRKLTNFNFADVRNFAHVQHLMDSGSDSD